MAETGSDFVEEGSPEGEEVGLDQIKELVGLFVRSPRRHPWLAAAALITTLAFGVLVAMFWPRSFGCSVRLLAQRNLVLPALGNPNRSVPREADSPTHNAADTILQRENIVATITQLDLLGRWESTRQPVLRLKDRIFSVLGTRSDDDKLLDMIGLLEKRLSVVSDDSSITLSIEWPDRNLAFEIVTFLQKNFLEARYDTNVNVISEAIRILEERAKPLAVEVDAALAGVTKLEADRREAPARTTAGYGGGGRVRRASAATPLAAASATSVTPAPVGDDPDDAAVELEDVRRRVRFFKEDRDRQALQAKNQLADARATLGPMHPTVVALNEKIAQLAADPPDLQALTARERQLVAQLAKASIPPPAPVATATAGGGGGGGGTAGAAGGSGAAGGGGGGAISDTPAASGPLRLTADLRDDPEFALALEKLQAATTKYNELLSRIEAANIELDVTRAAFKYQYTVVKPPELARKPSKPNVLLVLIASIVTSIFLMLFLPGGLDLWRGRFVERWQVTRKLNLPILGELNPPS